MIRDNVNDFQATLIDEVISVSDFLNKIPDNMRGMTELAIFSQCQNENGMKHQSIFQTLMDMQSEWRIKDLLSLRRDMDLSVNAGQEENADRTTSTRFKRARWSIMPRVKFKVHKTMPRLQNDGAIMRFLSQILGTSYVICNLRTI